MTKPVEIFQPVKHIDLITSEPSHPSVLSIRKSFADRLRFESDGGQTKNGIREIAIMAKQCQAALNKAGFATGIDIFLDFSIGDIDWRTFNNQEDRETANALGLNPESTKRKEMDAYIQEMRVESAQGLIDSIWNYQPEALGMYQLREHFSEFIRYYGLPHSPNETILSPGSLAGIDGAIGAINFIALKHGSKINFIFPTPGFTVVAAQARRRGIEVITIPTQEKQGYCVEAGVLGQKIGEKNDFSILYLTPMANPTSTIYDAQTLSNTIAEFLESRPNGVLLVDLAYLEMVSDERAKGLLSVFNTSTILNSTIFSVSMSKLFYDPRLRMASLYTLNPSLFTELQAQWQTSFASISGPAELEALAKWRYVTKDVRKRAFEILRKRQDTVIELLRVTNVKRSEKGLSNIVDPTKIYRDIPLYIYARLASGFDYLDLFTDTGILGVPGEVFGDLPQNNMIRLSMGMQSLY